MRLFDRPSALRHRRARPLRRTAPGRHAVRLETLEPRVLLAVVDDLRIAEIMYHPADPPPGGAFDERDFEFVELINTGPAAISLEGVSFVDGIDFSFTGSAVTMLDPDQRVLVVSNQAAFASRYGAGRLIAGEFSRSLSNSSDTVELFHEALGLIQTVSYQDRWHRNSDGNGFSLVMLDPAVDDALWDDPTSWRASLLGGGSPGEAEPALESGDVVINEMLAHTDQPGGDWIELHNTTDRDVNIAGWFISDNENEPARYQVDADRFIPAGGYVTFTQDADFGNAGNPLAARPFGFSELGESAHLSSWDLRGLNASYREAVFFAASDREVTFGRYTRSDRSVVFVSMRSSTPGVANSPPLVGPVVISEIMYHPAGGQDGEFVELHNPGNQPVPLFDPLHPENTWMLRDEGGNRLSFPRGVIIDPGGYLLIVGVEPAVFRGSHDVPDGVAVIGPFGGGLSNSGEFIELLRPGDPELDLSVPMYLTDRVRYDDDPPWPTEPDGAGFSLVRRVAGEFGDDAVNWGASQQIGGTPGRAERSLAGDTNGDGRVDVDDLNNVRNNFGAVGAGVTGDANGDGRVDVDDLNAVRNNFGARAPARAAVQSTSSGGTIRADSAAHPSVRRELTLMRRRLPHRLQAARVPADVWDQAVADVAERFALDRAAWRLSFISR